MQTPIERVARALVESTSGPFDLLSEDGKKAAMIEAEAAIRELANITDEEWKIVGKYLHADSKTNLWAAIDGLADINIH